MHDEIISVSYLQNLFLLMTTTRYTACFKMFFVTELFYTFDDDAPQKIRNCFMVLAKTLSQACLTSLAKHFCIVDFTSSIFFQNQIGSFRCFWYRHIMFILVSYYLKILGPTFMENFACEKFFKHNY